MQDKAARQAAIPVLTCWDQCAAPNCHSNPSPPTHPGSRRTAPAWWWMLRAAGPQTATRTPGSKAVTAEGWCWQSQHDDGCRHRGSCTAWHDSGSQTTAKPSTHLAAAGGQAAGVAAAAVAAALRVCWHALYMYGMEWRAGDCHLESYPQASTHNPKVSPAHPTRLTGLSMLTQAVAMGGSRLAWSAGAAVAAAAAAQAASPANTVGGAAGGAAAEALAGGSKVVGSVVMGSGWWAVGGGQWVVGQWWWAGQAAGAAQVVAVVGAGPGASGAAPGAAMAASTMAVGQAEALGAAGGWLPGAALPQLPAAGWVLGRGSLWAASSGSSDACPSPVGATAAGEAGRCAAQAAGSLGAAAGAPGARGAEAVAGWVLASGWVVGSSSSSPSSSSSAASRSTAGAGPAPSSRVSGAGGAAMAAVGRAVAAAEADTLTVRSEVLAFLAGCASTSHACK